MRVCVTIFVVMVALTGCAIPQISELQAISPNEEFVVQAPLNCLYEKGIEHVSSYIGMTEPRFTWYINLNQSYAWFRQPLTLVELHTKTEGATQVRRSQTASAEGFGQGTDLVEFLKTNPCH